MILMQPFIDLLMEPEVYEMYCGKGSTDIEEHLQHVEDAKTIEKFYATGMNNHEHYQALIKILDKQPRIALYIPFSDLYLAPNCFAIAYMNAWLRCLQELDNCAEFCVNQKVKEPEMIVKAVHLLPWLFSYGYINGYQLADIAERQYWNMAFKAELRKILPTIEDKIEPRYLREIKEDICYSEADKKPEKPETIVISRNEQPQEFNNITGPFGNNMDVLAQKVKNWPDGNYVVLIGGGILKGCARSDNDFKTRTIRLGAKLRRAENAHLYMNTAWAIDMSSDAAQRMRAHMLRTMLNYGGAKRQAMLKAIERDLLRGELLRYGIVNAYPNNLDEAGPFYDDRYRRIATELFAKYVWLPNQF